MSEVFSGWDYTGDFLKQFPANYQGVVGTVFCQKVRAGAHTVEALLEAVERHAADRLAYPSEWDTSEGLETMRLLQTAAHTEEAERFARFILWRESLPYDERHRLKEASKAEKGGLYARQAMAALPPTEKQLALLRAKRCPTVPATRLEAHDLIDSYLNRKGTVR